jgi:hypothetical protein
MQRMVNAGNMPCNMTISLKYLECCECGKNSRSGVEGEIILQDFTIMTVFETQTRDIVLYCALFQNLVRIIAKNVELISPILCDGICLR